MHCFLKSIVIDLLPHSLAIAIAVLALYGAIFKHHFLVKIAFLGHYTTHLRYKGAGIIDYAL